MKYHRIYFSITFMNQTSLIYLYTFKNNLSFFYLTYVSNDIQHCKSTFGLKIVNYFLCCLQWMNYELHNSPEYIHIISIEPLNVIFRYIGFARNVSMHSRHNDSYFSFAQYIQLCQQPPKYFHCVSKISIAQPLNCFIGLMTLLRCI